MNPEVYKWKLRTKKALEAELAKMPKPHDLKGFRRRSYLQYRIVKLEQELRQHTLL